MILRTSELSICATEDSEFKQIDALIEQANEYGCRLVHFAGDPAGHVCGPGGFIVKYIGAKESLDRLLEELGCFDGDEIKKVEISNNTYTLVYFD
tara:strand:+ start:346 stop:630 length:285 start_codon:yes stop_codon:yes gene_type:complete